jgi:5,10-methylene-tetrahydrofolate dehydrogenase/methenyl tetrahydrofolate cyclohydrolase
MVINGRAIAQEILHDVRTVLAGAPCTMRAIAVAPTAATRSYLRIKHKAALEAGITLHIVELPESVSQDELIEEVRQPADGVIVQLPLPLHLSVDAVVNAIPAHKDADVLSDEAKERKLVSAPVAGAVEEILTRAGISVKGKQVVVIGKGRLVGIPVSQRLRDLGAVVSTYDEHDFTGTVLKEAEIVVSGAGVPHLVKPDMLTRGVALIDAGTSEQSGVLVGDIDPACVALASAFTPVPGGVGPVTVARLMHNTAELRNMNIGVH